MSTEFCPACDAKYRGNARVCSVHAAAPDLYAALRRIADHESRADRRKPGMVDASELADMQRIARAALRKAEGE